MNVGFPISTKNNEKRRALLPNQLHEITNRSSLYFETGYGKALGYEDEDYLAAGANIAPLAEVLEQSVICDPKIGDANYIDRLHKGQVLFGWAHAVQNRAFTDKLIANGCTVYAWEDMFRGGRHVFWRNNELAGEAAIVHAFSLFSKRPADCKVALIGMGNVSRGAYKVLTSLGAEVVVYGRSMEELLREELEQHDVIVNGVLWDVGREGHIIHREDLGRLKKPSMIVDISCDHDGAIQTSVPTTIEAPVYVTDDVLHYAVDHTPALIAHSASEAVGREVCKYLDLFVEGREAESQVLQKALIVDRGKVIDERILSFQNR